MAINFLLNLIVNSRWYAHWRRQATCFERMTDAKVTLGTEKLILVKNRASEHLRRLLERQGRSEGALRVKVIGGGLLRGTVAVAR
jgi:hypothetical protein